MMSKKAMETVVLWWIFFILVTIAILAFISIQKGWLNDLFEPIKSTISGG